MKLFSRILMILLLLLFITACQSKPEKKPQSQQGEKTVQVDDAMAEKAKEQAMSVAGVEDAVAVVMDKDISSAVKVSGFDRLRLKGIREEVHQKIRTLDEDYQVHVTSDKKLFKGLQDIKKSVQGKSSAPESVHKQLEELNKAMKG